jgi:hypothetical protein
MFDQHQRIDQLKNGEDPPAVGLTLRFSSSTTSGETVLERVREVMRLVALAQGRAWLNDDEWRRHLPEWFVRSFEGHSAADLLTNADLWDFGSWLDAMKNPGWEWWSSCADQRGGVVRGVAHTDPFSIEPLAYLLRVSGASSLDFREE